MVPMVVLLLAASTHAQDAPAASAEARRNVEVAVEAVATTRRMQPTSIGGRLSIPWGEASWLEVAIEPATRSPRTTGAPLNPFEATSSGDRTFVRTVTWLHLRAGADLGKTVLRGSVSLADEAEIPLDVTATAGFRMAWGREAPLAVSSTDPPGPMVRHPIRAGPNAGLVLRVHASRRLIVRADVHGLLLAQPPPRFDLTAPERPARMVLWPSVGVGLTRRLGRVLPHSD